MREYERTVYVLYKDGKYHKTYRTLAHARSAISNSSHRVWDAEAGVYVFTEIDWEICEYDIRENNWQVS